MNLHVKVNGFTCPFNCFQILTYITFGISIYVFFFIEIISLTTFSVAPYILSVFYVIFVAFTFVLAFIATIIDPTDPTIYDEQRKRENGYDLLIF